MSVQGLAHAPDDVGPLQLVGREIDCHGEAFPALVAPGAKLAAGFVQHPQAELGHQPQGLGDGDESSRRHGAEVRAVPAQQGLEAGDLAAGGVELRLVVQLQFVTRNRLAQPCAEHQAVLELLHLLGREFADQVPALALGPAHRRFGAAQ